MRTTHPAPDVLTQLTAGLGDAVQQLWERSATAYEPWRRAWDGFAPGPPRPGCRDHEHGQHHETGCGDAGCADGDRCGCSDPCRCCVPDADVVVHARVGERRVVPFVLHNPRRREREVGVELGPWHLSHGEPVQMGAVQIEAVTDAPSRFVLGPCERRLVRLAVSVSRAGPAGDPDPKDDDDSRDDHGPRDAGRGSRADDVTGCLTICGEVRFTGCAAPQRVAVVVHPARCDALTVSCGCGCD